MIDPTPAPKRVCTVGSRSRIPGAMMGICHACQGPCYYSGVVQGDLIDDVCWLQQAADQDPRTLNMELGDISGFAKQLGITEAEAQVVAQDILARVKSDPMKALEAIQKPPPSSDEIRQFRESFREKQGPPRSGTSVEVPWKDARRPTHRNHLTVGEVILQLQQYNPDLPVFGDDPQEGLFDFTEVKLVNDGTTKGICIR